MNINHHVVNAPIFEPKSLQDQRDLAAEDFILTVSDYLVAAMQHARVNKKELADRLGKTKGHVTQVLTGNRNLTLRSIAEIAHALELTPTFGLVDQRGEQVQPEHLKRSYWGVPEIILVDARMAAPPPCSGEDRLVA